MGGLVESSERKPLEAEVILDVSENGFHICRSLSSDVHTLRACEPARGSLSKHLAVRIDIDNAVPCCIGAFRAL